MLIEKQSQAGKSFLMQSALVSTGAFFFLHPLFSMDCFNDYF